MMARPTNEWTSYIRITSLVAISVQNIQTLYKKLTCFQRESIDYYSKLVHDWEELLEFWFESVNENIDPLIPIIEAIRAFLRLKEYCAFLALDLNIYLPKYRFEQYKALLENTKAQIKIRSKTLPKIDGFVFRKALIQQLHKLNEELIIKKTQSARGILAWMKHLIKSIIAKPWRSVEVLRLLRPLILVSLVLGRKKMDLITLLVGLGIDLISIMTLKIKDKELTDIEKDEAKTRYLGLLRYVMYSPIYEFLLGKLTMVFSPNSIIIAMVSYYRYYSLLL